MPIIKILINTIFFTIYDCLYYFLIYCMPIMTCLYTEFSFKCIQNFFIKPKIIIQFACNKQQAMQIYEFFCISSNQYIKEIDLYSTNSIHHIYIYHTNSEQVISLIQKFKKLICLDYKVNFVINEIGNSSSMQDQYIVLIIFTVIITMVSRYRYFTIKNYEYLYAITSLIFAINSLLIYFFYLKKKLNITYLCCYNKNSELFFYTSLYIMLIYMLELTLILINIKKKN